MISVYFSVVRSPALRSPRSGTPRRHLITPVPGTRVVSPPLTLYPSIPPLFLLTICFVFVTFLSFYWNVRYEEAKLFLISASFHS